MPGINKFITDDTNVKLTNIAAIYNQYLIRNYLQKILKCQAAKLGFVRSKDLSKQRVLSTKVRERVLELLIKISECFVRVIICIKSKSLMYNCNSVWLGWALVA